MGASVKWVIAAPFHSLGLLLPVCAAGSAHFLASADILLIDAEEIRVWRLHQNIGRVCERAAPRRGVSPAHHCAKLQRAELSRAHGSANLDILSWVMSYLSLMESRGSSPLLLPPGRNRSFDRGSAPARLHVPGLGADHETGCKRCR